MSDNIKKLFLDAENQEIKYGDSSALPQLALDTATNEIKYAPEGSTLPEGVLPMEIDLDTGEFAYGEVEPPVASNRILYTVVEGGTQPTSTWITQNCTENIFDAETGTGELVLKGDVTTIAGSSQDETSIFNDEEQDENIASVVIPSQITSIGDYAFCECSELASVTIPSSVTSIGESAFRGCTGLTSVTIPDSVTSIGGNAFNNCTSLASVTCFATTPPALGTYAFESIDTNTCSVPEASIQAYKDDASWSAAFTTFEAAKV